MASAGSSSLSFPFPPLELGTPLRSWTANDYYLHREKFVSAGIGGGCKDFLPAHDPFEMTFVATVARARACPSTI